MEAKTQGHGTIGWAVSALQYGHKVRRVAWPAGHIAIFEGGHLYKRGISDRPWQADAADLLAADWVMADPVLPGQYHA